MDTHFKGIYQKIILPTLQNRGEGANDSPTSDFKQSINHVFTNIKLDPSILLQAQPLALVHVFDLDIQVSLQAFPELHHLQQLALSVTDSSTDPVHSASLA